MHSFFASIFCATQANLGPLATSEQKQEALATATLGSKRDEDRVLEAVLAESHSAGGPRLAMLRAALQTRRGVLIIDGVGEGRSGRATELVQAYLLNAVVAQPRLLIVAAAQRDKCETCLVSVRAPRAAPSLSRAAPRPAQPPSGTQLAVCTSREDVDSALTCTVRARAHDWSSGWSLAGCSPALCRGCHS